MGWVVDHSGGRVVLFKAFFWRGAGQFIYKCPDLGAQSGILNAHEHRGNFGGFVIKSALAFVVWIFQSLKEKSGWNIQDMRQFE